MIRDLPNPEATQALGRHLGHLLFPGAVVALIGPLGAGKTHLVRAIAEGLDIPDSRVVTSPTFVLIQEYQGRLPIYHFDAYRLRGSGEFGELGSQEYFDGDGVCLVEWADRVAESLPTEHLRLTLEVTGETSRSVRIEAIGSRYEPLLQQLRSFHPG
jgi:tRNA threonylcarbamoyladenosine biosynthesis protein TsaE